MLFLQVKWQRGEPRLKPADNWTRENRAYEPYYEEDAPVSHPKFADAKLVGNTWTWERRVYDGRKGGEEYGEDTLKHLRTWGVRASFELIKR